MGISYSPKLVTSGLILMLDIGDVNSYIGSGSDIINLMDANVGTLESGITVNGDNLTLNGSNYISYPSQPNLRISGDKTLSMWYFMGSTFSGGIAGKCDSTDRGMGLAYGYSGHGFIGIAWNSRNSPGIPPDSSRDSQKWVHITVKQTGNIRTLVVHDIQGKRSNTESSGIHTWDNDLFLGWGSNGDGMGRSPNGTQLANIMVYDRSLSDAEILRNFNAQKSRFI